MGGIVILAFAIVTYMTGALLAYLVIIRKEPLPVTRIDYAAHAIVAAFWLPCAFAAIALMLDDWRRTPGGRDAR